METFYTILGVSNHAKDSEIKKAYRKLSYEYHPDKNGGNKEKEEIYKKINEAYDVLKDHTKRKQYDYELCMTNSPSFSDEGDLSDILGQLFSGMSSMKSNKKKQSMFNHMDDVMFMSFPPPGMPNTQLFQSPEVCIEDIHHYVQISYQQAYDGMNLPITIKRDIHLGNNNYEEEETLYINIPTGIDNHEIITIDEKGNRKDKQKSSIKVHIELKPDSQFQRQGMDLIYIHELTFEESILGFSFVLNHLNGQHIKINNPKGKLILHQSNKTIKNLGFTRQVKNGNLILEFKIKDPEPFNEEQIKLFESIFQSKK